MFYSNMYTCNLETVDISVTIKTTRTIIDKQIVKSPLDNLSCKYICLSNFNMDRPNLKPICSYSDTTFYIEFSRENERIVRSKT